MTLHHTKHHQAYVNGLNDAEEKYSKATTTEEKITLQSAIKFNGGGNNIFSPLHLILTESFASR